jgi:hypothetical protein
MVLSLLDHVMLDVNVPWLNVYFCQLNHHEISLDKLHHDKWI